MREFDDADALGFAYTGVAGNNGNVQSETITAYDDAGVAQPVATQSFTYDSVNRLKSYTEGSVSETYCFDAHGNRAVQMAGGQSPRTPQVIAANCTEAGVSAVFPRNRWTGVTPDAAGNIKIDDTWAMTWDVEGRMATAAVTVSGAATTTTFGYDGEGRRVKKATAAVVSQFVYDAFGGLAMEVGGPAAAAGTQYLHTDHLGSTRLVTDGSGAVTRRYDYRPFGGELTGLDTSWRTTALKYDGSGVQVKFTGQLRDTETALDYFGARYFSGAQGRFTSPDAPLADQHPADPQSWNLYTYVRNNPLVRIDPTGYCSMMVYLEPDSPNECTAVQNLQVSSDMIRAMKGNEGKMLEAYIAPQGFDKDGKSNGRGLTVGYGHLVKPSEKIQKGDKITEEQADAMLTADVDQVAAGVRNTIGRSLVSQQEFDAMVDMAFGIGSLSKQTTPKLLNALENRDYEAMSGELRTDRATNGIVLPGLQKRSTQRENIFLNGNYAPVASPTSKR